MSLLPFGRNGHRHHDRQPDGPTMSSQSAVSSKAVILKGADSEGPLTLRQALTITAGLAGLVGLLSGGVIRFSLANSANARFLSPLQTFPTLADWPAADNTPDTTAGQAPQSQSPEIREVFPYEEAPYEEDIETLEESSWATESEQDDDWQDDNWQEDLPGTEAWDEGDDPDGALNWQTNEDDFDTFSSEGFTRAPGSTEASTGDRTYSSFDEFADRSAELSEPEPIDPLESLSKGPLLWRESSDEF